MVRKLSKSKAKSPAQKSTRRAKPQRGAQKSHAQRTAAKHQARKADGRFYWLAKTWKKARAQSFTVPKLDLELPLLPTIAFVSVLSVAVGAGYWGAKSLFSTAKTVAQASAPAMVIQQTHSLRGVILPEPNGGAPHEKLAYEEKALEEVYEPALEPVPGPEAMIEPEPSSLEVEVAAIPKPSQEVVPTGPQPLWMQNALAFTPPANMPMIAIVIDDMGVDRKRSKRMWQDVSAPLTLSFMSYADDLPSQTQAARAKGHELMLHMSMEPSNPQIDAGPNVLLSAMPSSEIRSLANWGMDRFEGFVGVNNHMGSRFTEDEPGMRAVLEEINKRGLFFLDSRTSGRTVGPRIARELGMPMLERNVFLDNENVPQKVRKQLAEVERLARKYGHAIAIGHPRDATIEVLKTWIDEAKARGLAMVPVTVLLKARLQRQTKLGVN